MGTIILQIRMVVPFHIALNISAPAWETTHIGADLKRPDSECNQYLIDRTAPKVLGGESLKELIILPTFSAWFWIFFT
jgi:hypothetical protein